MEALGLSESATIDTKLSTAANDKAAPVDEIPSKELYVRLKDAER